MNHNTMTAAVCLAALALAACDGRQGPAGNSKICADFKAAKTTPAATTPQPSADAAAPLDDCVRRWAYSLAPSRDEAEMVAEAAVAACGGALSRWNQQSLTQQPTSGGPVEAISITTGQPTNPMAEHNAFAHARALLYVVQARAGRCAPPPAADGAPAGVTN